MTDPNKNVYDKVAADNTANDSYQLPAQSRTTYIVGLLRNLMASVRNTGDLSLGKVGASTGQSLTTTNIHTVDGGWYRYESSATGNPASGNNGLVHCYRSDGSRTQVAFTDNAKIFIRTRRTDTDFSGTDAWTDAGSDLSDNAIKDIVGDIFEDSASIDSTYNSQTRRASFAIRGDSVDPPKLKMNDRVAGQAIRLSGDLTRFEGFNAAQSNEDLEVLLESFDNSATGWNEVSGASADVPFVSTTRSSSLPTLNTATGLTYTVKFNDVSPVNSGVWVVVRYPTKIGTNADILATYRLYSGDDGYNEKYKLNESNASRLRNLGASGNFTYFAVKVDDMPVGTDYAVERYEKLLLNSDYIDFDAMFYSIIKAHIEHSKIGYNAVKSGPQDGYPTSTPITALPNVDTVNPGSIVVVQADNADKAKVYVAESSYNQPNANRHRVVVPLRGSAYPTFQLGRTGEATDPNYDNSNNFLGYASFHTDSNNVQIYVSKQAVAGTGANPTSIYVSSPQANNGQLMTFSYVREATLVLGNNDSRQYLVYSATGIRSQPVSGTDITMLFYSNSQGTAPIQFGASTITVPAEFVDVGGASYPHVKAVRKASGNILMNHTTYTLQPMTATEWDDLGVSVSNGLVVLPKGKYYMEFMATAFYQDVRGSTTSLNDQLFVGIGLTPQGSSSVSYHGLTAGFPGTLVASGYHTQVQGNALVDIAAATGHVGIYGKESLTGANIALSGSLDDSVASAWITFTKVS